MALDLTRPYTTVVGPGHTHKYVQDGKKFDIRGYEMNGKPEIKDVFPCRMVGCEFIAKTKAGLATHVRARHGDLKPEEETRHGLESGEPPGE